MKTLSLLFLLSVLISVSALIAYDCSGNGEKSVYLHGEQRNCSQYGRLKHQEHDWRGTILQVPLTTTSSHKTCNLVLRQYTMYCTYSRNPTQLELLSDDMTQLTYKLTGKECLRAWEYQEFTFSKVNIPLKVPGITKIMIGAEIDEQGFCKTRKATSKVVKGHIELLWSDVIEWSNIEGNPSSRTLDGSELTWIENRTASKTVDGIVVLSNNPPSASCQWEMLYQGHGIILQYENSFKYIVIPSLPGGFKLISEIKLCKLSVITTDDASIYIINSTSIDVPEAKKGFRGRWSSVISSGITGLNLLQQLSQTRSNQILLENQCILEDMIRETAIQQALNNPNQAALSLIGSKGWTMIVAGNAVVLKRCIEKEIQIMPQKDCYTDIPISLGNSTFAHFMHPTTRIIQLSSFKISCSDDALPIFSIRNKHYKLTPELTLLGEIQAFPSRLSKLNLTWYHVGTGLYSSEILQTMDKNMDHTSRREEVTRQLIKIGDGSFHDVQDGSGVLGNMVGLVFHSAPSHWFFSIVLIMSILSIILNLILWGIIWKSKLWLVLFGDKRIAAYQAELLSLNKD